MVGWVSKRGVDLRWGEALQEPLQLLGMETPARVAPAAKAEGFMERGEAFGDSSRNRRGRTAERASVSAVDGLGPGPIREEARKGDVVVGEGAVAGRIDDGLGQRTVIANAESISQRIAGVARVLVQRLRRNAGRPSPERQQSGQPPCRSATRYAPIREPRGGGDWYAFFSLPSHLPRASAGGRKLYHMRVIRGTQSLGVCPLRGLSQAKWDALSIDSEKPAARPLLLPAWCCQGVCASVSRASG